MVDHSVSHLWLMRGMFVGTALIIMFLHMLPMSATPARWAPPDVILALAFAWGTRRPEFVPALLVVAVVLLTDFLFQRPPGLWTALVLLAVERGKSEERRPEESTFAVEWLSFAMLVTLIFVAYRAVLSLTLTDSGPLFLSVMQAGFTILIYPLVVAVTHFIFRVRRLAPGDIESFG